MFNFKRSRDDIKDLIVTIKSEAIQENTFNSHELYKFENRYKFYISNIEVEYFRTIFVPARFFIKHKGHLLPIDSGDKLFQMKKREPKSFKSLVRLFIFCIVKYLKDFTKPDLEQITLLRRLKENVCDKSETWVKHHGL